MDSQFIVLKTGREKYTRVCVDEILYILAEGNYTIVKTETRNKILLCSNLKNTLEKINNENLIKINRSTVINYKKVLDFSAGKKPLIRLINKDTFTPTKKYIENIKEKIIHTEKGAIHTKKE
jgi:DNA-binding LytR/AlgR family response regulator